MHIVTDNTAVIRAKMRTNVPLALRFMLNDIKQDSLPITPMLNGDLRRNVKISVTGNRGRIHWGQKYAAYQERGYTSGPVKRYTTPGTRAHFAEDSVKGVMRRGEHYFRKARVV